MDMDERTEVTNEAALECYCGQNSCYSCRYLYIIETAVRIAHREMRLCAGMTGFDIEAHAWRMANDYRCKALRDLAFEQLARGN